MQHKHIISAIVAGAVITTAACSGDSTSVPGTASGQLAFMASNGVAASSSVVPTTVGSHTLDLTGVTFTISRAELKRTPSENCPGDDDEDDDHPHATGSTESCGELKVGPTTVDLPLDGKVITIPANTIPAGTFRKFELRVSQVQLKGTFDGTAFDVTVSVRAKAEAEFSTPLVVTDSTPVAITINVPVGGWFLNSDGSLIDPRSLAGSATLRAQVANRIRASLRAFEDHDHDGHEDHGGNSGRG
jgi:hypothetical protein